MSIKYEVTPQSGLFAVVRTGPQGGKRTVSVYSDEDTAKRVRDALWAAIPLEATGRG